ncbi:hypothetical protein QBC38DRAFT_90796 [Podospora fimiseda]|uniref:RRM domain-containing protein n=1 Tax=Podospora fimiseda TaxID=252190 RepID=A0AAN7BZ17_9PEZI|nr:hypothetical protein QBC38DRAFT_90796 [Podospora fimiseda]
MAAATFPAKRFELMPPSERGGVIMWEWAFAENNTRSVPQPKMAFYLGMPRKARCVFSLNDQVKTPRFFGPLGPPKRPAIAWDNTKIEEEACSLRNRYPDEANKVRRPNAWEDLYTYYDPYDLWFKGAWNLWCVIDFLGEQNQARYNLRKAAAVVVSTTAPVPGYSLVNPGEKAEAVTTAQDQLKDYQRDLQEQAERFQIVDHWVFAWLTHEWNRLKISKWDHSASILYLLWPEDYMSIGTDLLADECLRLEQTLEFWHREYYCASGIEPPNNGPPDPRYPVTPGMIRQWTACRFKPREPEPEPITDESPAVEPVASEAAVKDEIKQSPDANTSSAIQEEEATPAEEKMAPKIHHKATMSGPVVPIMVDPELANRRDGVEESGPSRLPSRPMESVAEESVSSESQTPDVEHAPQVNTVQVPTFNYNMPSGGFDFTFNNNMPNGEFELTSRLSQRHRRLSSCLNSFTHPFSGLPMINRGPYKECPCTRCTQASRTVYVKNFDLENNKSSNERRDALTSYFSQWGEVEYTTLTVTQSNRGMYAMVRLKLPSCAETAIHAARGHPIPTLSSSAWTWYPFYHKDWRPEPDPPSPRWKVKYGWNGSPPYYPRKNSSPPLTRRPHISPPRAPVNPPQGPVNMPAADHQQGPPHMTSWGNHSQPMEFIPPHPGYYGGPHPDAFSWQYPRYEHYPNEYPPPMSAPLSGCHENPYHTGQEVPLPRSAGWFPPQKQPPLPEVPIVVQSKVPLEPPSIPHRDSIVSTNSEESGIRVRLPSMSPEKVTSAGRESPVTSKEPATPEKPSLKSLDPSIVAEGRIVPPNTCLERPPCTSQFRAGDIRFEQAYSATVIHRPDRQNNSRRLPSIWTSRGTNDKEPQKPLQSEPIAKECTNQRNKNNRSRPSILVNAENKPGPTKGYRANAGGSLKMTRNRNSLAINTQGPVARSSEVEGVNVTLLEPPPLHTARSYHSAKSTLSSRGSSPDSGDQLFVSAPQTPLEFNTDSNTSSATLSGNASPALTAIPADRCQLTPKESHASLDIYDATPKKAVASKDKTQEPAINETLGDKADQKEVKPGDSSNEQDDKKSSSRPPSRTDGRKLKFNNRGDGQKPHQSGNKTGNKSRAPMPVQSSEKQVQHKNSQEKINPASVQSAQKEAQDKAESTAKPTTSTQQGSQNEEQKKPGASVVNAQPAKQNNNNKKRNQLSKKPSLQSLIKAEDKGASSNIKGDEKVNKSVKLDEKPSKATDNGNMVENGSVKVIDNTASIDGTAAASSTSAQSPVKTEAPPCCAPLSSTANPSPKKNKKAARKRNLAKKKVHEASVASVPGASY